MSTSEDRRMVTETKIVTAGEVVEGDFLKTKKQGIWGVKKITHRKKRMITFTLVRGCTGMYHEYKPEAKVEIVWNRWV